MKKILELIKDIRIIIGAIIALVAGTAWAVDYLHRPFVLKTELMTLFNARDINTHQVNITKLEIRRGLASTSHKMQEYDMLISIERLQILKLKGVR